MSDFTVINHVGRTLKNILADYFDADSIKLIDRSDIALLPPGHPDMDDKKLSIFLYSIKENAFMKNRKTEEPAPLSLDFFYLFTADSGDYPTDNLILGKVMQVFHDHAVLSGSVLTGASLEGTDHQLRVVMHTPPMDETFQLWQSFPDKPFRLSICYQVTPILIDSLRETTQKPVLESGAQWGQLAGGGNQND